MKILHIGDPCKGADIIVRLAVDPEYQSVTGGYFNVGTGKSIIPIYPGGDNLMETKLWNDTSDLLKERNYTLD